MSWRDVAHTWDTWECDCPSKAGHFWNGERVIVVTETATTGEIREGCPTWRPVTRTTCERTDTAARKAEAELKAAAEPDEAAEAAPEAATGWVVMERAAPVVDLAVLPVSAKPLVRHAGVVTRSVARQVEPVALPPVTFYGLRGVAPWQDGTVRWGALFAGGKFERALWGGWPVKVRTLTARLEGKPDPVSKPRTPRKGAAPAPSRRKDVTFE